MKKLLKTTSSLTKSTLTILTITLLLSSCALLDKLRGGISPHSDMLIEVPVVTEDVRG